MYCRYIVLLISRVYLFVLCVFSLLFLFACNEPVDLGSNDIIIVPSLESKLLKVYSYDSIDRISVVIMGEHNTMFKNSKEIWLDNLRVLYISYKDEGIIYTELSSDKGKVNYDTLDAEAWGNTVIKRENTMRVETQKVFWDNDDELFFTKGDEEVVIYKRNSSKDTVLKVIGINLVADKKLELVELDSSLSLSPYIDSY